MSAICGFAGPASPDLVGAMLARLRHRGAAGPIMRLDTRGAMGACAVPLREPSAAATSADSSVHCVLDGQLFGSTELANDLARRGVALSGAHPPGDAELLANLYMLEGEACFERLDGRFAAALATEQRLVLVRDPLGEKPLYYAADVAGTLLFASEAKAFLACPAFRVEPDLDSLVKLLVCSFVPGSGTMFRGVHQLGPGSLLRVDFDRPSGSAEMRRYFELREHTEDLPEAECVERVLHAVRRAVHKRLPADGKVAAFLSGGIDSSAVVALLAEQGVRPVCLSVAFGQDPSEDLGYARTVAQHCGLEHHVLQIEPEDFLPELPSIIYALDDPLCDCIVVPNYLLAREAARTAPVVFNGEGGDPLFGGPKNKFMILGEWYGFLGGYDRARAYLASYHKFYDHLGELLTPELAARTGGSVALEQMVRPFLQDEGMRSFLNRLMHVNIRLKGGQNILVKVEKMVGAHGVVAASPLFDRELTELSFVVPPALKRRGDVEKYVFKRAVEPLLPKTVVYRKKTGMGVPLSDWFRSSVLREYATDLLLSPCALGRGYFRPEFVRALLQGEGVPGAIGHNRSGELLWMLLAIELWHRVYVDRAGQDARP